MRLGTFGYQVDFFMCLACVAALSWLESVSETALFGRLEWLTSLVVGVGLWTLVEYGVHRWLYHGVPFLIPLHDAHHDEPSAYIGAPPLVGIVLIFFVIYFPANSVSPTIASGLTSGMLLGYMGYQLVHHATHFWKPATGSYLYRARLHHSGHHYHQPIGNFGVTTAFWDKVFRTLVDVKRNVVVADVPK